jgi:hypothetical protein
VRYFGDALSPQAGKTAVYLLFKDSAAGDQFGLFQGLPVLLQGDILKIEMVAIAHRYNNGGG